MAKSVSHQAKQQASERRTSPRLPTKLVVRFTTPRAFLDQYTHNISKGGLFIKMENPLPVDTQLEFEIHLPLTRREIRIKGQVVHVQPEEGAMPTGVGVQFVDLDEETKKTLDAYVHALLDKQAKGRL